MNKHKCDKFGDKREGWNNCSVCGETDWKGLYKYKFETVEVINLITQNVKLCDRLVQEEMLYRENNNEVKLLASELDSSIENEENLDVLIYHIDSLSKKNRMLLFIQSHDFIFSTSWVKTMRSMRRWGFEV